MCLSVCVWEGGAEGGGERVRGRERRGGGGGGGM